MFLADQAQHVHLLTLDREQLMTCVGGTQFNPSYDSKGKDTSTVHTALESVWNDRTGASGGGVSTFFARPSYQVGTGVPAGSMRLVPDVSLGASPLSPGYYIVAFYQGKNQIGTVGGTSLSSPAWAGYSRLIAKTANAAKLGNLNPQIYKIGNLGSSAGLVDVLTGNNSFNLVCGFVAGPGYDQSTGWGSPDMSLALVSLLSGGTAVATPASISDPPKTVISNAGVLTLTNTSVAPLTVNSITVGIEPLVDLQVSEYDGRSADRYAQEGQIDGLQLQPGGHDSGERQRRLYAGSHDGAKGTARVSVFDTDCRRDRR